MVNSSCAACTTFYDFLRARGRYSSGYFYGCYGCTLVDYILCVLHMQLSLPVLKSLRRRPLLKHVCRTMTATTRSALRVRAILLTTTYFIIIYSKWVAVWIGSSIEDSLNFRERYGNKTGYKGALDAAAVVAAFFCATLHLTTCLYSHKARILATSCFYFVYKCPIEWRVYDRIKGYRL